MKEFKIRCSGITNIMAKPTGSRIVSAGAETYMKKWLTEQLYERREEIQSKYMDKGNAVEGDSIDYISKCLYDRDLIKNDEFFSDDFMKGTPDVITENEIIEVKNSWNCFTFPLLDTELKNKAYFYQVQGYMHLTGLKKAKVIYTLMDTPEDVIERQWNPNKGEYDLFREKFIFSHISDEYRIKVFNIDYDADVIETIKSRVLACREYLDKLKISLSL
jgi:hypothetical protein